MNQKNVMSETVLQQVRVIGENLRTARLRRDQKQPEWAEGMSGSASTVKRLEKGDIGVSLGHFIASLHLIDPKMVEAIVKACAPENDPTGIALEKKKERQRAGRTTVPAQPVDPMSAEAWGSSQTGAAA
mgnify:CR=1 FL=1